MTERSKFDWSLASYDKALEKLKHFLETPIEDERD